MFLKSFPHYPHKNIKFGGLFEGNKRTDVLYSCNKNYVLSKKSEKEVDI